MRQPVSSPSKFAEWINSALPGMHRKVDAEDIRDMTECGLIGRYGRFYRTDLEVVRGILQYEQLRYNRQQREEIRGSGGKIHCRRCGVELPPQPDGKKGRPREFCTACQTHRARDRYNKWYVEHRAKNPS